MIWKSFEISTKFNTKTLCTVPGNLVTKCSVMLHTAFQRWGCHIWACRERESGSDRVCRWSGRNKNCGNLSLSKYVLFAEPMECNTGVRSWNKQYKYGRWKRVNQCKNSGWQRRGRSYLANSVFGGEYGRYLTGSALVRKTGQWNRKQNAATGIENRVSSSGNIAALRRIVHTSKCAGNSTKERAQITRR